MLAHLLFISFAAAEPSTAISCPAESPAHKPLIAANVIEILDGTEGDLAPDRETKKPSGIVEQQWDLFPIPGNKFILRCTYRDTKETITRELSRDFRLCIKLLQPAGKVPDSIICKP